MIREVPPTAGFPVRLKDLMALFHPGDLSGRLADFLGVDAVDIESSGTACLRIAFETLKQMSERQVVVLPGYTCPLVVRAVQAAGLTPRLCDTGEGSWDFDPASLSSALTEEALCVVPTHLGGLPADMETVRAQAARVGAFVVEDAAQALGATWRGRKLGTLGDIGVLSLSRGKGLTIYEGGVLVAPDRDLRERIAGVAAELSAARPALETLRTLELFGYALFYNPVGLYFLYGEPLRRRLGRGDRVGAVGDDFPPGVEMHRVGRARCNIAAASFERFPAWLESVAERGRRRAARLAAVDGLAVFREGPDASGSWPFLMVLMPDEAAAERALADLWRGGRGVTKLFVHDLSSYEYLKGALPPGQTPNARALAGRMLTVTNSDWLGDEEFEQICAVLTRALP